VYVPVGDIPSPRFCTFGISGGHFILIVIVQGYDYLRSSIGPWNDRCVKSIA
jgi:hypothetical protein